ncbi:SusC/RagA family TonB-linked outer membrane protein [Sphingobacterium sp. JUb56]|uniref:SusC/RagA family TonB-linked outer membrane protein n=1 Tax=Sphingobacterium sp. JUb56 TaxID=2587145 RepID=UPI001621B2E8|nr:SusC/RagA family TonB-linked outer membrane protein [Sphingobacterium sp. JUb56]MBB2954274.1 TonB-linked SusC/RagA family outer membrane protein [Sphingobacterium sp. JUb56]
MKKAFVFYSLLICCGTGSVTHSKAKPFEVRKSHLHGWKQGKDSSLSDTLSKDSIVYYSLDPARPFLGRDTVNLANIQNRPYLTLEQMLKGNIAGVYVQEPSGEPGTIKQNMMVRGLSRPILSAVDFNKSKPLVVLNGIPLIDDPSIIYDIQNYSIQPIGSATSLNSMFDLDNIESIHVLKDYSTLAIYGPRAVNGVIYITTKNAKAGQRKMSVNGHYGFAEPSGVSTINAEFEKTFREPFYRRYATLQQQSAYPAYLSDSSNVNFYGPSNWTDSYYQQKPIYAINGSLEGGSERANFRFFGNYKGDAGAADETSLKRYQAAFYLNMQPVTWLTISSMLQGTRLERGRNRSIIERLGETAFIPDLSTPIAPNKDMYGLYLNEYKKTIDDNVNSSLLGSFSLNFAILKNLNFSPKIHLDYNENVRNVFWPSTLMSGNNYVSNYFGYNERLVFDNLLNYKYEFDTEKSLLLEGGFNFQADAQKYNYIQGYKGPNDFIKVNVVEGNSDKSNYLKSVGFIPYYYQDRIEHRLASLYARATYEKKDEYQLSALIRHDGSSAIQPSNRWFTSYTASTAYNLNYLIKSDAFNFFKVLASWGRMGDVPTNDRDAAGPQYSSELGWKGNNNIFSYNGIGTISRPYQSGWIGYDLPWSYTDLFNAGFDIELQNKRISARVEYYNKNSKDVIFAVPTVAESGYQFERLSGMDINNQGIDLAVNFNYPSQNNGFSWNGSFNVSYNTNALKALPNGLQEVEIGTRKLEVGKRIDQFWLLQNKGIYQNDVDIPVDPKNYKILTYNGTTMKGGDPRWVDQNGDYDINNDDRNLMGNVIPKYTGGFYNRFAYRQIDFSFLLYFNLKKDILNAQAARYFDFANQDEAHDLSAVRDITYWEKNFDEKAYPMYNPWSPVAPYQAEQDMFMEDGSFLKLRNITLGYDFTKLAQANNIKFTKLYLYATASNLLTISKYSGRDPELVDFYGYDNGLGLRLPKTFVLGLKMDF